MKISIISSFTLHKLNNNINGFELEDVANVRVIVSKAEGKKCQRCWKYKQVLIRDELCQRCEKAIS